MAESEQTAASLVCRTGARAGRLYLLRSATTRIGRDPDCGIVPEAAESAVVSGRHAEVVHENDSWILRDLDSTNGTYVNGERIRQQELAPGDVVRLGGAGPEFEFRTADQPQHPLDMTLVSADLAPKPTIEHKTEEEELLARAVHRARIARSSGAHGQTMTIMREMLGKAVHKSGRRHRWTIALLVVALAALGTFSLWRIQQLKEAKSTVEERILRIESELEAGDLEESEIAALLEQLDQYQNQARHLQDSVFYRFGVEGREEAFIEREILALMSEFGAEKYSVPPEFIDQVQRFVERFRTGDREIVEGVIGPHREDLASMREIFQSHKLPPDLAYMVLVESAFITQSRSRKGAVGLWQFTPATARAYGLKVDTGIDERTDLVKATHASAKYIRELILDFGSGSSVMLALAAYNYGPRRVKRAVRRVDDPINQRNFWHLYQERALPIETRQYVPKIVAAIIIGRNLERFGF